MANKNEVAVKTNVGDSVIARINRMCDAGLKMPKDFNHINAIKMSMLVLQDLKDKNGKPALEVCSQNSIATALFRMCCKGLNLALNQCYATVRETTLCIDEEYFGKVLMVKRIFPDWEPVPRVIREGDVFEYGINSKNGRMYVIKHEQKLENIDKDFVGGYIYLPTKDGEGELYVMSRKQIMAAWSKSSSREQTTHKTFDEKMVGKTLVNSGCNMIIKSTPEYSIAEDNNPYDNEENAENNLKQLADHVDDWQEAEEVQDAPQADVAKEETKEEEETDF